MRSRPEIHQLAQEPDQLPLMFRHFAGEGYETMEDHKRLDAQHLRVKKAMKDGFWRTLEEIHELTGDPVASISAQLRHLRKQGFGAHTINKRKRGPGGGLWEYQFIQNPKEAEEEARKFFFAKHPKPMKETP